PPNDAHGATTEEFTSRSARDLVERPAMLQSASVRALPDLNNAGPAKHRERDGRLIDVDATSIRLAYDGHAARLVVVTALTQRRGLEGQLQQSQRLETVGQLAGGMAHDFNHLLAVVRNYAGFVAAELPQGGPRRDVEAIPRAATGAADLTRQLLIF